MTEGGLLRSDAADAALHPRNFRHHLRHTLKEKDGDAELLEQSQSSAEFENESQSSYSSIREMYKNEIAKFVRPLLEQDNSWKKIERVECLSSPSYFMSSLKAGMTPHIISQILMSCCRLVR